MTSGSGAAALAHGNVQRPAAPGELAPLKIYREDWASYKGPGHAFPAASRGWQMRNEVHVRWPRPPFRAVRSWFKAAPGQEKARAGRFAVIVAALVFLVLLVPRVWPWLRRRILWHEMEHAIQPDFGGNKDHHDDERWAAMHPHGVRHYCGRATSWQGRFSRKHLKTPFELVLQAEEAEVVQVPAIPGSNVAFVSKVRR